MVRVGTAVVSLVLLAVAWSGCIGSEQGTGPQASPGGQDQALQVLEATGCREHVGIFSMDSQAVAPYLPEGYAPNPPLPPDLYTDEDPTGATATLLVVAMACEEPQGFQNTFVWIPVVPPEQARDPDLYYAAVALACVADGPQVDHLASWKVPCRQGTVALEAQLDTPALSVAELTAETEGTRWTLAGTAPGAESEVGAEWIRVFHTVDRGVCAVSDLRVGVHQHQQFGEASLEVQGSAGHPLPQGPGLHSIGHTPFAMNMTLLPDGAGVVDGQAPGCPG